MPHYLIRILKINQEKFSIIILHILISVAMEYSLGTQERVRINHGKRAICGLAIEETTLIGCLVQDLVHFMSRVFLYY